MRARAIDPVSRKVTSYRQEAVIEMDEARRSLLLNVIDTYLKLSAEEETEFERLLGQPELKEVKQMVTVYELRGMRRTILNLLRARFGELPQSVVAKVEAITDEARLDELSQRVLTAPSLEAMGLDDRAANDA